MFAYVLVVKCTDAWTKLYEVAADGSPLFGDITAITDALREGAEFRIHILPELFLEVNNAALKSGLVCASSLFVLSKSNWDTFASSMFWRYTMVCSDGMVYQARIYLGKQEQLPSLQSSSHSIWYTRKLKGSQQRPNPLYCTDSTFEPTCNNVADIISTSEQGMSIKVAYHFGTPAYYLNSIHRLEVDSGSCRLVAQMPWKIGKSASSGRYYTPLYWYIALIDTEAIRTVTRWYIGDHTFNSESTGTLLYTEWFVDTCWALVFSHGVNGEPLSGSKETLTELILQGRRVQVVFGPYTMEADNVIIDNDIVTAQLLGQIDTLTATSFKPGKAEWKWVRISSNGKYNVDLYDIGASQKKGQSTSTVQVSWVIESRVWRLVLRTDSFGNDVIGSKAFLKRALKEGSRLRCVIYEQPTVKLVVTADNIEMSVDDNIAAQVFRLISFDDSDTAFIPFWRILLITTKGELKETRWTVGEHQHRGNVVNHVQIDWFVD
ncbi:uncharacterized protein [Argopecten irradians]|uniref:uncharacterized protein n=1 Tax=Argopecten irradians TaxID=31199 RepID=UPI0037185999